MKSKHNEPNKNCLNLKNGTEEESPHFSQMCILNDSMSSTVKIAISVIKALLEIWSFKSEMSYLQLFN